MVKLDIKAMGLSVGILWGGSVLILGISAPLCPWAGRIVSALAPFYVGYDSTLVGAVIGGLWGFLDGAIGAALIAWLYNKLAKV